MTDYPKVHEPILLPGLKNVTDLRKDKAKDGQVYEAIFEVLHHGKEAHLPRRFRVDKMLITDFCLLIEKIYPKTFRGMCISTDLST